jgi:hypothetical protein
VDDGMKKFAEGDIKMGAIQNVAPVLGSAYPSFSGMYQRQFSNPTFNLAAMH